LPGFDERLKQHLEEVAPPADPSGAFDRILEKKIRRRVVRRLQVAGLAFAVVGATVGGTFALVEAFRSSGRSERLGGTSHGAVRNGLLAYVSKQSGNYDIWTARPNGTRVDNITAESLANETEPAWSPDGTRIAFVSDRDGGSSIYVMNAGGGEVRRLASGLQPAWSPDGGRIAFLGRGLHLFVMKADGSNVTEASNGDFVRHPTWAPDGSKIAFSRSVPSFGPVGGEQGGIDVVDLDGGDLTELTRNSRLSDPVDTSPDWSPDGTKIVFERGGEIYVMNADGSGPRNLTGIKRTTSLSANPAWSPDGRKIVFEQLGIGPFEIVTMNGDGSGITQTRLSVGNSSVGSPDWQPIPVASSPSPGPTGQPSVRPTPSPFPAECDASQVNGDFEGDDAPDLAVIAKTECLMGEAERTAPYTTVYALHMQWFAPESGHPAEGIAPLPDCKDACQALAATDLNLDGIDELILKVDERQSTQYFQVYELPASEAFGGPAEVAEPGVPGFPGGEPAMFVLGGSVKHYTALGCDLMEHQVIVQIAELNAEQTRYNVHETLLRFDPIEAPPFGGFTVVSERDFTEQYEAGVGPGDQFEPGDPCWMQAF
jgi:Tol biopolymer transport system component